MTPDREGHPSKALDDLVHQRTRLGILTVLLEAGRSDFVYLRDTLELTDGNLGRHLDVLAQADLVRIDKEFVGKRPRTWVTITPRGGQALDRQLRTMRALLDRLPRNRTATTPGASPNGLPETG